MPSSSREGTSSLQTLPEHVIKELSARRVATGDVLAERFRVEELLGGGAMGEVFAAENLIIGMPVAIKVLRGELLADASFRARFQQEAEAIASVRHPNIVRFLDLVVGVPTFLVMERVRGKTLAALLVEGGRRQPMLPLRVAHIIEQLCWGLYAAHRAGVIHRDLKPSNILIEVDDERGEMPKIIDFGLAKTVATAGDQLTRTGQIVGTPDYMSPEQIAGRTVDARADLYALGCVAYELLTARLPFAPAENDAKEDLKVLYRHVHEDVTPPSKHNPTIPASVDAVVLRMLAKLPEDRYATMKDAASAWLRAVEKRGDRRGSTAPGWRAFALGALTTAVLAGASGGVAIAVRRARTVQNASTVLVDSSPADAVVFLDGKRHPENTPTAITNLPAGDHVIALSHPGFDSVERTVHFGSGERRALQVALPPEQRHVEISTVPPGAFVYLDNHLAGVTPLRVDTAVDDFHEVRVEKDGFESQTRALRPEDNAAPIAISLAAETERRGALIVEADRALEVWIDGAFTGFRAPTIPLHATQGKHLVELRDAGRVLATQTTTVEGGHTVRVQLRTGQ